MARLYKTQFPRLFFIFYVVFKIFIYLHVVYGFKPIFNELTKRYARLVNGNVRNFRRQESMMVHANSVGCLLHLPTKVILTTSILRSGISAPRFLLQNVFMVLERQHCCTRHKQGLMP